MASEIVRKRPVFFWFAAAWLFLLCGLVTIALLTGRSLNLFVNAYLWVSIIASLAAFAAYGIDKRRAVKDKQRIPEKTLHLMALVGGWPGAVLGQQIFRHKTQKIGFRVILWTIITLHIVAVGYAIYSLLQ